MASNDRDLRLGTCPHDLFPLTAVQRTFPSGTAVVSSAIDWNVQNLSRMASPLWNGLVALDQGEWVIEMVEKGAPFLVSSGFSEADRVVIRMPQSTSSRSLAPAHDRLDHPVPATDVDEWRAKHPHGTELPQLRSLGESS